MMTLHQSGLRTKKASKILATLPTALKREILHKIAFKIHEMRHAILEANQKDLQAAKKKGLSTAMLDRLTLTDQGICDMQSGINEVADQEDPVGAVVSSTRRPNGLRVEKKRIPLGVIGVIYESRPNVTVEAAALCLYSGNGLMLRGGSEAFHSNRALVKLMQDVLHEYELADVLTMPTSCDRTDVDTMARLNDVLDVIIPRGGPGLIRRIYEVATVPIIAHHMGNCHMYIDATADIEKALALSINSKTQRPGVCNALETLLVNKQIAERFMPQFLEAMKKKQVQVRGCSITQKYSTSVMPVTAEDFDTEFLDLILAVKVVEDIDAAIAHIRTHTSHHTEAIVSQSAEAIALFTASLDSSAIMVNASTRFNDGRELGLGAEIGISTTKLHAYGPMGLNELTATQFVVTGSGQLKT